MWDKVFRMEQMTLRRVKITVDNYNESFNKNWETLPSLPLSRVPPNRYCNAKQAFAVQLELIKLSKISESQIRPVLPLSLPFSFNFSLPSSLSTTATQSKHVQFIVSAQKNWVVTQFVSEGILLLTPYSSSGQLKTVLSLYCSSKSHDVF